MLDLGEVFDLMFEFVIERLIGLRKIGDELDRGLKDLFLQRHAVIFLNIFKVCLAIITHPFQLCTTSRFGNFLSTSSILADKIYQPLLFFVYAL